METSWGKKIVGSLDPAQDIVNKIKLLRLKKGRIGIVNYRVGIFPVTVYNALLERLLGATFEDVTEAMTDVANEISRTSEEVLTLLRKTCEILDLSYSTVAEDLKPGVRERELWSCSRTCHLDERRLVPPIFCSEGRVQPPLPKNRGVT
mgnify:CR=1 FL=1